MPQIFHVSYNYKTKKEIEQYSSRLTRCILSEQVLTVIRNSSRFSFKLPSWVEAPFWFSYVLVTNEITWCHFKSTKQHNNIVSTSGHSLHFKHVINNRKSIHTDCSNLSRHLSLSLLNSSGGAVAQSVERATPGEEVPGSIPPVAAGSLLVGSVSV